jgi:type I restriction enzyme S subunit
VSGAMVSLSRLIAEKVPTVDPSKFPDEEFELWSIPAFDAGRPEIVNGENIGSSKQAVLPGDVLLSKIVPHIRRAWVVEKVGTRRQIASGEWIVFRGATFDPKFLRHILVSNDFHSLFMMTVAGVGGSLLRARPQAVKALSIFLPPLSEQKRIAAILDQANDLRRKSAAILRGSKELNQAIFHSMFDACPQDQFLPLGEIISLRSGEGLTAKMQHGGEIPVYGGNGINGWHDVSNVKANTIVIGRVGVYCGAVHRTDRPAWVTDNALIATPKIEISMRYLEDALLQANLNQYANTSSQPLVSGGRLKPVKILVPSRALQDEYQRVSVMIERQKNVTSLSANRSDALFISLQHRAFRGEL